MTYNPPSPPSSPPPSGNPGGRLFFTKNGRFLGWAFDFVPLSIQALYPLVGLDSYHAISVNFGGGTFLPPSLLPLPCLS